MLSLCIIFIANVIYVIILLDVINLNHFLWLSIIELFFIFIQTMNEKEKKRFHEMADKDKMRYDTEMQSYIPPKGEKVRGKKRKQIKDPNAPKRSLLVFFQLS